MEMATLSAMRSRNSVPRPSWKWYALGLAHAMTPNKFSCATIGMRASDLMDSWEDKEDYVKRIIGSPGDKVQLLNGVVYINSEPISKTQIKDFVEIDKNNNIFRNINILSTKSLINFE